MNGGQLPTNQLHDISWGILDHASGAPQLMSCNHYVPVGGGGCIHVRQLSVYTYLVCVMCVQLCTMYTCMCAGVNTYVCTL